MPRAPVANAPEPRDAGARPRALRATLGVLVAVLAVAAVAFWPILSNGLVYDDVVVVERNPAIASFAQIPAQFSGAMWDFLEPVERNRVGYWRPLMNVALTAANVWGGGTARAFHLLSLLAHLGATAAAFALALRLARSLPVAGFAALLFALHPVQVESVAWLSSLNSLLFGGFAFLALERFFAWRDRHVEGGLRRAPWASGVLLLCALLSKELAIAAVPCALALDLARAWPRSTAGERASAWRRFLLPAYVPFAAALFLYYVARVLVFGGLGAGFDITTTDFGVSAQRMTLLRVELLGGFLELLAWPAELNLFRPFRPEVYPFDATMLPAWIAIAAAGAIALVLWRARARLALGALAFAVAAVLPVVVGVKSIGIFPLSERFLYLAAFGFALALARAAFQWLPRAVAGLVLALVAGVYAVRSHARTEFWRDEPTLFARSAEASPQSPYVQWGLGRVLLERYRERMADPSDDDLKDLANAHRAFDAALELGNRAQHGDGAIFAVVSDFVQANVGLAWCLLYEAEIDGYGDYETPLTVLENVVRRYPGEESGHTALGVVLQRLGRFDEAERAFLRAAELNPRFAESWHNLGLVRMRRAQWKSAADAFERALALRPDRLDDLLWLARAEAESGQLDRALELCARAAERHPRASGPYVVRATVLAQQAKFDEAIELARRALELDPDDGEAQLLKGRLHARVEENAAAERAFVRAAELLPSSFEAHYNAGAILLRKEELGVVRALPFLLRAYELRGPGAAGDALRETLRRLEIREPELLWSLGSADAARDDVESAMDWVQRALDAKPDHGPSHVLLGFLLKKKGDVAGAIDAYTKACRELPDGFQPRQALATLLIEQGRFDDALAALEEAYAIAQKAQGENPEAAGALAALRAQIDEVRAKAGGR